MKKLFLIIAIALLSATSSFAYTIVEIRGGGRDASYYPNTRAISYTLEVERGTGSSFIQAFFNTGGTSYENLAGQASGTTLITGTLEAPANSYISMLNLETVLFPGQTGFPTAKASW